MWTFEHVVIADIRHPAKMILERAPARSPPEYGFAEDPSMLFLRRYTPAGCPFPQTRHHFVLDFPDDQLRHGRLIALISREPQVYQIANSSKAPWNRCHRSGMHLVMRTPTASRRTGTPIARTIRFPRRLRERIAADAERCGRSFEAHVIAILRRHFGEDVDIAPAPRTIIDLAKASLAGIGRADERRVTARLVDTSTR